MIMYTDTTVGLMLFCVTDGKKVGLKPVRINWKVSTEYGPLACVIGSEGNYFFGHGS